MAGSDEICLAIEQVLKEQDVIAAFILIVNRDGDVHNLGCGRAMSQAVIHALLQYMVQHEALPNHVTLIDRNKLDS